jgi:hypothetical protein
MVAGPSVAFSKPPQLASLKKDHDLLSRLRLQDEKPRLVYAC